MRQAAAADAAALGAYLLVRADAGEIAAPKVGNEHDVTAIATVSLIRAMNSSEASVTPTPIATVRSTSTVSRNVADVVLPDPGSPVSHTVSPRGTAHTAATWYDWEDGRVLLNMDESRRRLAFMRRDPRVTLTALGHEDWGRYVTLFGRIVRIEPDADLADIDRLAIRYARVPFRARDARRYSAWMRVETWYGWDGSSPWPTPTP